MKISVIGMGAVGTEIVGTLMVMPEINEIVAVNRTRAKAEGEVLDLLHTTAFNYARNPNLRAGDYPDIAGSDIVVVAVGAVMREAQTRDDLLHANHDIVRALMPDLERHAPDSIVLVVTNPVDVVTQLALRYSNFPKRRVISLGTVVDTARLMRIVSERIGLDPKNIFGYVLGDHSETAFIPWSICNVCGMDIDTYCRLNDVPILDRDLIRREVTEAGFAILRRKGNTNHGIAASVCRIVRAIIADEHSVLPVGTLLEGEYGVDGTVMSVPCVIGRQGVERIVKYHFTTAEMWELNASERHLRQLLESSGALPHAPPRAGPLEPHTK
jgi:L-lactate dehydrogenase